MALDIAIPEVPLWRRPWLVLVAGMALTVVALVLTNLAPLAIAPRVLIVFAGVLLAGIAVRLRLKHPREELEQRAESAALLSLAGVTALLAYFTMDDEWVSGHRLFGALAIVAFCGAVLILCAGTLRKVIVSILVVYHLGGIVAAITMMPPPTGGAAAFIPHRLWMSIYRPYLGFLFMNNAYHFYSPEPGPAWHMWFYVKYADGKGVWHKIPNRADSPVNLHYQRLLSIPMLSLADNSLGVVPEDLAEAMFDDASKARMKESGQNLRLEAFTRIVQTRKGTPLTAGLDIPPYPGVPEAQQYQAPSDVSRIHISAIVRRAAHMYATRADNPDARVVSIKMYRVVHRILTPSQFARGESPLDETSFEVYYQGEYRPDGKLWNETDPFLYWQIPILRNLATGQLQDYVQTHAETDYLGVYGKKDEKEEAPK